VKLYSYFRSSAAYRVRIALNLKSVDYETQSIHLVKDGGHNKRPEFRAINPQMRVPVLVTTAGEVLIQSLAIIEYLDETHPQPPLLPKDPLARARVRALAELIACDIHPLNNTSSLRYLKNNMAQQQSAIDEWYRHWIITGFEALEELITPGPFACGSEITMADLCLVPQVNNARRLNVPLERFPKIVGVDRACLAIAAFDRARPENQPDAE
jgi:maleylacetoacetate isomerase